uniref:Uncharacterized protein n=1 Tax=Lepeophtheirus salmonis TaxID=72036 RepID=A0A0K2U765_LEPSM
MLHNCRKSSKKKGNLRPHLANLKESFVSQYRKRPLRGLLTNNHIPYL